MRVTGTVPHSKCLTTRRKGIFVSSKADDSRNGPPANGHLLHFTNDERASRRSPLDQSTYRATGHIDFFGEELLTHADGAGGPGMDRTSARSIRMAGGGLTGCWAYNKSHPRR